MTIQLANEHLVVSISRQGAELTSIQSTHTHTEYLWQGDEAYWKRQAPVLFPVVGKLKDDQYSLDGKTYTMTQHGFARDKEFELVSSTDTEACFRLVSDASTKEVYPFEFVLTITYTLEQQSIKVGYHVENPHVSDVLYFSIGGHPAFNVPLTAETTFEDYYVSFSPRKSRPQIPLKGPYADLSHKTLGQTDTALALRWELFDNDALIYETTGKNTFTIKSDKTEKSVSFTFEDFPFVGIWSPPQKQAPFVCIEPWFGLADTTDTNGNFKEKVGIQTLNPKAVFKAHYSVTFGE